MDEEWSLELELTQLTGKSTSRDALISIGILKSPNEQFQLVKIDNSWSRGGAETYVYKFGVQRDQEKEERFILKACVSDNIAFGIVETIERWIERRKLISATGIATPKLYVFRSGVLLEEYIPYSVTPEFVAASPFRTELFCKLALVSGILQRLGFAPIGLFEDLRSRGNDVVVTDFGQDLGPPNSEITSQKPLLLYNQLLNFLRRSKVSISQDILDYTMYCYLSAFSGNTDIETINCGSS